MKRARHTEEQIIAVLQEAQVGATIEELCHRHGISAATYYKWKQKFGGLEANDARRLRLLEDENRKLKGLVTEQGPYSWIEKAVIVKLPDGRVRDLLDVMTEVIKFWQQ